MKDRKWRGGLGFAPHNVVRALSRAEKGSVTGGRIVLACDSTVRCGPRAAAGSRKRRPTMSMLIPPPVKSSALSALSFEAMPQLGALMFALPWKLREPVNAKAHGDFVRN